MFKSWTRQPMVFRKGRHRAHGSDRKDPGTRWEGVQEPGVGRSVPQLDPCEKEPRLHSNHRKTLTVCNSPSFAVRAIEANMRGSTPPICRKIARGCTIRKRNEITHRVLATHKNPSQISRREKIKRDCGNPNEIFYD